MPPQQSDGLLGGFALALDFGAHDDGYLEAATPSEPARD
jgi:hypothetical protein